MALILEASGRLLQENGDDLLLEDHVPAGPVTVNGTATGTWSQWDAAAAGTVVAPRVHLPAGIHATDDYTATVGAVVNDCTSITGWQNFLHSGQQIGTGDVETVDGSVCVSNTMQTEPLNPAHGHVPPVWRLNLASDVPVGTATRLILECYWSPSSQFLPGRLVTPHFSIRVASAVNLGGTVLSVPYPAYTEKSFNPVEVPVEGLSTVRSLAFVMDGLGVPSGAVRFSVREIRFANETGIDRALGRTTPSATIISPTYTTPVAQDPRPVTPGEVTVDLRPGHVHISRLNGIRYLREWGVPEDGETEVSALLTRVIHELGDYETLAFPAGGLFRVERPVVFTGKRGVTLDCNGSRFYWTTWRGGNNNVSDPGFAFTYSTGCTFRGARIHGWRDRTYQGSALVNDAGTPTVVSTTKTLDGQGDAVTTQGSGRFYMRHLLAQFSPHVRALILDHDPQFQVGTVATFTLSDTHPVEGDAVVELVYTDDSTVLAARALTLTAAPTEYAVTADPDPRRRYKIRVRKATSLDNTITVHAAHEYGFIGYDINHDSATAVGGGEGLRDFTVDDVQVEGCSTDGFDFTHSTMNGVTLRNVVSRGACRQGMSFNYGSNVTVDGFLVGECGRSAVDIEPYGVDWWVRGVTIRNGRIYNPTNYAFACNNWAQITHLHIDNIQVDGAGIGLIIGGGVDSSVTNIRADPGPDTGTGKWATFNGVRLRVAGISHRGEFTLDNQASGEDPTIINTASDIMNRDGDVVIRAGWSTSHITQVP